MSALNPTAPFVPTRGRMEPENRPDELADAVVGSLARARWGYFRRPWGLFKTLLAAVPTLGLLPLLIWPRRFHNLMVVEEQQYWHLAEWMRLRTGKPEATALRDQAASLGPGVGSRVLSLLIPILAAATMLQLLLIPGGSWPVLWHAAYGSGLDYWDWYEPTFVFWRRWTLILSAGYFFHWFQVCRHSGALGQFVRRFNELTAPEGVRPVRAADVGIGFHPLWALAALIGAAHAAYLAIPLAMAGVVHQRYVWVTMRQTRADLARRVRGMLLTSRPALEVRAARCVNGKCRAFLQPASVFCPRCGARAAV